MLSDGDQKGIVNCLIGAMMLLAVSCYNNQIHYDLEAQTIKTCNGKNISYLFIESEKGEVWEFHRKAGTEGVNVFNLNSPSSSYTLTRGDIALPVDSFRLLPKHQYIITNHTYVDAADSEIEVNTDENGKIRRAKPEICK